MQNHQNKLDQEPFPETPISHTESSWSFGELFEDRMPNQGLDFKAGVQPMIYSRKESGLGCQNFIPYASSRVLSEGMDKRKTVFEQN